MGKRWDEALRSLARRSQGPFQALAYGVTGAPEGESELAVDLENLLRGADLRRDADVVAEVADPFTGAAQRPLFKSRVLPWITSTGRSTVPDRALASSPEQSRRDLETVAADLAGFLDGLDEGPPASRPFFRLIEDPAPAASKERRAERGVAPIVVVRQFEDLGCDAEGIAGSIEAILTRGGHLFVVSEGLDTRTRDGRASAGLAIRLGRIKADRARERSLKELTRRREELQVYGPVPFGFTRRGQGLIPVPEQMESVARVRELARRGSTLLETALALNREQRCWKDGTPWTWRRVRQVLHNRIYDRSLRGVEA